ncbi:hypothetical protein Tco_1577962 [Tanacetum coccineum]
MISMMLRLVFSPWRGETADPKEAKEESTSLLEAKMSAAIARGHGGDGGGDDPSRPPPRPIGTGVGGRKAIREGGRDGGSKGMMLHVRQTLRGRITLSASSSGSSRCTTLPGTPSRSPRGRTSWDDSWSVGQTQWDKQIDFWLDPKHAARAAQNDQNQAKSTEEMLRLRDSGANTPLGVPYTEEEILALPRGTYTNAEIDEMLTSRDKMIDEPKEEAKRTRPELELLRRVVTSDD